MRNDHLYARSELALGCQQTHHQRPLVSWQRLLNSGGGSGCWPASANRRKKKSRVGKRRRPLEVELRVLQASDPRIDLLTAVEFITSDPAHRVTLYSCCTAGDRSIRSSGVAQDEACLLKIASSVDKDLAFLQRRAAAEGFKVEMKPCPCPGRAQDGSGYSPLPVTLHDGVSMRASLFGPPADMASVRLSW